MALTRIDPPILSDNDIQRFWSKVDKSPGQGPDGECWLWTARYSTDKKGRKSPLVSVNPGKRPRTIHSPRLAYFITYALWPSEMVLHTCDNSMCVRPSHLYPGNHERNMKDMKERKRAATGERHAMHKHPDKRCPGAKNGSAKLTVEAVQRIRISLGGRGNIKRLAESEGVSRETIWHVRKGLSWIEQ